MNKIPENRLLELRRSKGFSRSEAHKLIGISFSLLIKHEQHERPMTGEQIEKYAKLYGVEPYEIFKD